MCAEADCAMAASFCSFWFFHDSNHFNFNEIFVPLAGFMYVFGQ
jgi:hypothetical protein